MHKEQFDYFALVYQTRNYSAAAKMVPMSPQGFTKSIHALENELGVPLFTDVNGALTPTSYADEFMKFTDTVTKNYRMLDETFRRINALERHEIRLGTSLGIIGFLGTEFLRGFHERHADIRVSYNETNDNECEQGLLRGTYDFAFTLAPFQSQFITTSLYTTQVYFWVNTASPLSSKAVLGLSDLQGNSIGLPGKDFRIYDSVVGACASNGVELQDVFTSNEIFWLYEYVAQRKGIAFTLPHLAKLSVFSNNDKIVAIPLEGFPWTFGLSRPLSRAQTLHEKVFMDYCVDYAIDLPDRYALMESEGA